MICRLLLSVLLLSSMSCMAQNIQRPEEGQSGSTGAGGPEVNPDACQVAGDAGRKLRMFLVATVALDRAVSDAYQEAHTACRDMGEALGLPPTTLDGDVKEVCDAVAVSIKEHLVTPGGAQCEVVAAYKPAVCRVDASAAARVTAECEGSASADVSVRCEGVCRGECAGTCDGTCAAKNASGQCAGACDGTCRGNCQGECSGHADVDASAECEAAAEVQANVDARCEPPELDITFVKAEAMDEAKSAKVKAAIMAGLPRLLVLHAKLTGPVQAAFVAWSRSVAGLRDLGAGMGAAAVCVTGQMAGAAAALVRIEARISITVEASASVSAAAGGSAG